MTPNPMVTRDTTSATQALQLMVEKHFRHLVNFAFINVNLVGLERWLTVSFYQPGSPSVMRMAMWSVF